MALLYLRSTPLDNHLPSPAEILYNRKIRTKLPTLLSADNRRSDNNCVQEAKNSNNNKNAKDLPELIVGSKVVRNI